MKKIGLIGRGFVGEAVLQGMVHVFEVYWHDPYKPKWESFNKEHRCDTLKELLTVDGPIFLCLPTPMKKDGSADISVVENVVADVNFIVAITKQPKPILIIKSTVPPGTTEMLNQRYDRVDCVFNPEFLTERTAIEDFKNQNHIIIGGPHKAVSIVKQMYQHAYAEVPTTKTSSTIAEMVKYVTNCFFAVKVSLANEFSQICRKLNIDYDKVIEYATKNERLGTTHWSVPGHDGRLGFGGKCFCKDINALIALAKTLKVDPKIMQAAFDKNLEIRPERDWEEIPGVISKE